MGTVMRVMHNNFEEITNGIEMIDSRKNKPNVLFMFTVNVLFLAI